MGSGNFRPGRQLAFAADRRGVEVLAYDRENPLLSAPLAKFVLPDVIDIEVRTDHLQGHADVTLRDGGQARRARDRRERSARAAASRLPHGRVAPRPGALGEPSLRRRRDRRSEDLRRERRRRDEARGDRPDGRRPRRRDPLPARLRRGRGGRAGRRRRALPRGARIVGGSSSRRGATSLDVLFQYSRPIARDGAPADESALPLAGSWPCATRTSGRSSSTPPNRVT